MNARTVNRITDREADSFAGRAVPGSRLADGGGLFLFITPAGTAVWRVKYRHAGKEKLYSPGVYPAVTLAEARVARDHVKAQLLKGIDPVQGRRLTRATAEVASDTTFGGVALDWLERRRAGGWSDVHYLKSRQALERDVLPTLGKLPVTDITPAMVAAMVQRIAARGAIDTAGKVLQHVRSIFDYATIVAGTFANPSTAARQVLPRRMPVRHHAALKTWAEIGDLLRRADRAPLTREVHMAHRLIAFTVQRIGTVVEAEWGAFDLDSDTPTWTIPRASMKVKAREWDHQVLLGPTIADELRAWRKATGGKGYLFPSPATKSGREHITRESVIKAYASTLGMRDKHSPHGWRSAFSTAAHDAGFDEKAIDLTLDHVSHSKVKRAYDHSERLEERRRLCLWWDAQLTAAQHGEGQ